MATLTLRHGAHRFALGLPGLSAGSGVDTSALLSYDFNYSAWAVYDPTSEYVVRASLVFDGNVTGAATNNFAAQVSQYSVAGVLKNQILYTFALGTNATAFVPIDLTGPAAGALTNPTGVPIQQGWPLVPGDTLSVRRQSSNATGLISPAFTVTLAIGVPS